MRPALGAAVRNPARATSPARTLIIAPLLEHSTSASRRCSRGLRRGNRRCRSQPGPQSWSACWSHGAESNRELIRRNPGAVVADPDRGLAGAPDVDVMRRAPASSAFSMSSFTTDAGRSITRRPLSRRRLWREQLDRCGQRVSLERSSYSFCRASRGLRIVGLAGPRALCAAGPERHRSQGRAAAPAAPADAAAPAPRAPAGPGQ